jgi:hypothetical protein
VANHGAATAGYSKVDLINEAPPRATDHAAGPSVTQGSAMLSHPTPEEDETPLLFNNLDEELEYLWH